jgi:hypothetical protein
MKKLALFLVVIGALMLCTATSTKATTVRLYFKITVTNTCNPIWPGSYCVQLKLTYNNVPITTAVTNCNVQSGGCSYFDLDIKNCLADPEYGVQVMAASETGGACPQTYTNNFPGGLWSWDQMQSCTNAPAFGITL